jgi:hypothetical protein
MTWISHTQQYADTQDYDTNICLLHSSDLQDKTVYSYSVVYSGFGYEGLVER